MERFDLGVIGGGLVGLSVAYQFIQKYPDRSVVVLEKENDVCLHQSGRNSGVIHSGVYYKPGSLKAQNCIHGKRLLEEFCDKYQVAWKRCGKLIVATEDLEIDRLQNIYQRGLANGVKCEWCSPERLREIEPHVAGIAGVFVPSTGVVDFKGMAHRLKELLIFNGHKVMLRTELKAIKNENEVVLVTSKGEFQVKNFVNCAGLYSDKVLGLEGQQLQCKIIPFRGEYYEIKPESAYLCKALIYPVPNPAFPFLGVHFTRSFADEVECGPNAVLALAREGYNWSTVRLFELIESLSYSGFHKLAKKYWKEGFEEIIRSFSKSKFLNALQRLVPELKATDIVPGIAGVRAQAIHEDGSLVDDFVIEKTNRGVHVVNAPSPAATSCLSLGEKICDMMG